MFPVPVHPQLASSQVSGSLLHIPQASAADSGEYVCRVSHGSAVHEASMVVTIEGGTGSSYREFPRWALGWRDAVAGSAGASPIEMDPSFLLSRSSRGRHPPNKDRNLLRGHLRGADPGPELPGGGPVPTQSHVVQAWGRPAGPQPGKGTLLEKPGSCGIPRQNLELRNLGGPEAAAGSW